MTLDITTLDDIDVTKDTQTIKLKLIYNYTLHYILPVDLEGIIHDYINDIINVIIETEYDDEYGFLISIDNQRINYVPSSFAYKYRFKDIVNIYTINSFVSSAIAIINNYNKFISYSYSQIINKYMKYTCIDDSGLYNALYKNYRVETIHDNNVLSFSINDSLNLQIRIDNHAIFTQHILMMLCINKQIDQIINTY